MSQSLTESELESIRSHCVSFRMTLAIVRTREAPTELGQLFDSLAEACSMSFVRNLWSPTSEFGFAELNSNENTLVLLYIGGARTELVSVSEIDEAFVRDLEDAISSSNIQSSTIRDGL